MSEFTLIERHAVPRLRLELQVYAHPGGARHVHLANDDAHRAFAVAFRTVPEDDTGLPHILEHLSLCGSRRFPARDPFFMMLRRSLQTFMNAFTYPDMTCYPFATQVAKDFDHLLDIYLDAVFAPRLDALDFAQEGWRLEPVQPGAVEPGPDPAQWTLCGVVYNEMKGAMGSTDAQIFDALGRHLLPDTCYRFNSGGDPRAIPDLRHEDLLAFHARHYGGANACFTTYGDLDTKRVQDRFAPYLEAHPGAVIPPPGLQTPLSLDCVVEVPVPHAAGQDLRDISAVSMAWLWGDDADIDQALKAEVVDRLLTGHDAAPLTLALDSSGLGRSSSGSGYMSALRNGVFMADMAGLDPADYKRFRPLVEETLGAVVRDGLPREEVAAALHQVEIARRRIGGDRLPYGLELCLHVVKQWNHGGDIRSGVDQDEAIARVRDWAQDPAVITDAVRMWLLDNPHRIELQAQPDDVFTARQETAARDLITERIAVLDDLQRGALHAAALALAQRQGQEVDPAGLPTLAPEDIPAQRPWSTGRRSGAATVFAAGTNGLAHAVAVLPLGPVSQEQIPLLPTLCTALGHLGVGVRDYRAQAAHIIATCGGCSAGHDISRSPDGSVVRGVVTCDVHGLADRAAEFLTHPRAALQDLRLDEHERLHELNTQALDNLQHAVLSQGHVLAAAAAGRACGERAALAHNLYGLGRLPWLRAICTDRDRAVALMGDLRGLLESLAAGPVHLALINDDPEALLPVLNQAWEGCQQVETLPVIGLELPGDQTLAPTCFTTATAVNYCAMAYPAPPMTHPDAAALAVAAQYLRDQVLHNRIRERGGAYGSMARYDGNTGTFTMASYRDPRLQATYDDMRHAARWLIDHPHDPRLLHEAVLGVIARWDAPASPVGEARRRLMGDLLDRGPEVLDPLRRAILAVTDEDLSRVAVTWLDNEAAHVAVITDPATAKAQCPDWEHVAL